MIYISQEKRRKRRRREEGEIDKGEARARSRRARGRKEKGSSRGKGRKEGRGEEKEEEEEEKRRRREEEDHMISLLLSKGMRRSRKLESSRTDRSWNPPGRSLPYHNCQIILSSYGGSAASSSSFTCNWHRSPFTDSSWDL